MKHIFSVLWSMLIGGLLFLTPIVALFVVLSKALTFAHKFVDPLAARIPIKSVMGLRTPALAAIAVIVLFCFVAGFLARTAMARKVVRDLERVVLSKVPGYEAFKGKSESILGVDKKMAYPVVLARFDDAWQIGFRIEDLENGLVTVFVPDAPNPKSGTVYLVDSERVKSLDIAPTIAQECLRGLGVGSDALLRAASSPIPIN